MVTKCLKIKVYISLNHHHYNQITKEKYILISGVENMSIAAIPCPARFTATIEKLHVAVIDALAGKIVKCNFCLIF